MTRLSVVGVDPGQHGAIAHLTPGGLTIWDMPTIGAGDIDPWALTTLFADIGPVDRVIIEQLNSFNMGRQSAFNFGRGLGRLEGVLAALQRPLTHVTPAVWTRTFGVGADKRLHRQRATELFPEHADLFRLNKHDGRADAALIAEHGRRQLAIEGAA